MAQVAVDKRIKQDFAEEVSFAAAEEVRICDFADSVEQKIMEHRAAEERLSEDVLRLISDIRGMAEVIEAAAHEFLVLNGYRHLRPELKAHVNGRIDAFLTQMRERRQSSARPMSIDEILEREG